MGQPSDSTLDADGEAQKRARWTTGLGEVVEDRDAWAYFQWALKVQSQKFVESLIIAGKLAINRGLHLEGASSF